MSCRVMALATIALAVGGCSNRDTSKANHDHKPAMDASVVLVPPQLLSSGSSAEVSRSTGPIGIPAASLGRFAEASNSVSEPSPIRPGRALDPDRINTKEAHGVTLTALWKWQDMPAPPSHAEVNGAGIKQALEATRFQWQIELLAAGRMRVVFDSPSFVLSQYTELRARTDLFGHVLVWPMDRHYRVVPVGAMRALLDERRVDAAPVVDSRTVVESQGRPRFGFPTRTITFSASPWAKLELTQARTTNVGAGGALLCRLLVEIAGINPNTTHCDDDKVPVHAKYDWKGGASMVWEVMSLLIRNDFQTQFLAVPPVRASFVDTGLPPETAGIFLNTTQVASFRNKALTHKFPRTDPEAQGAPGEGFFAKNDTDSLRYFVIDTVPVAWVRPHQQQYLIGLPPGKYSVQWRSFLGLYVEPPREVLLPGRVVLSNRLEAKPAGSNAPQMP